LYADAHPAGQHGKFFFILFVNECALRWVNEAIIDETGIDWKRKRSNSYRTMGEKKRNPKAIVNQFS
jgi:hypothetical protein